MIDYKELIPLHIFLTFSIRLLAFYAQILTSNGFNLLEDIKKGCKNAIKFQKSLFHILLTFVGRYSVIDPHTYHSGPHHNTPIAGYSA